MKIVIVYPEKETNTKGFYHFINSLLNKPQDEPRELLGLSIQFPITWETKLVDLNATTLNEKTLEWADYIVIKADVNQKRSTDALVHKCKLAQKKIIGEGALFTKQKEDYKSVDHLILHGASLKNFIFDLEDGEAKSVYLPLQIKKNKPVRPYSLLGFSTFFSKGIQTFSA